MSYIYKPIDQVQHSTEGRVVRKSQKLYLGKDTELTQSFRITNVISGSSETRLSSSYYNSLNIHFYLSGSSRFKSAYSNNSTDINRLNNPILSYLMEDSFRLKFNESSSIISIPQQYFGESVVSGTFTYINSSHPSGTIKLVDDGKGNLYAPTADISKSNSSALSSSENYVGNISYNTGVVVVTETGSFSHSSPSTGSIIINKKITGSNFFSITGSDGTSIKFICQNFGTDTSTTRYFASASAITNTTLSASKAINDFFGGEHITASSTKNRVTMSNDSNLLKSRMPTYKYAFQDNYPPISGSYGHITASGFGGGKAPVLYNYIGDDGPTTYDMDNHYLTYKSQIRIYHSEYTCVLRPGEFNISGNPTARGYLNTGSNGTSPSGSYIGERHLSDILNPNLTASGWTPYATQIGLYRSHDNGRIDPEPVIVGSFTNPIKTNRKVPIVIKIKLDT